MLKSGSPVMTIELVEEKNVRCVWFEGNDEKKFISLGDIS
jgi:uncharacterized protein YodC (DUF2158 family)